MKTKTIKLYQFNELPTEARKKVLDKQSDINVDYEWWDFVYDDFHSLASLLGVSVDLKKTYFTGFYHQGQGAAFTADIDVLKLVAGIKSEAWKEHAPKENLKFYPVTRNIERVCKLIAAGIIDFSAWIEPANRETSIIVQIEYGTPNRIGEGSLIRTTEAINELITLVEDAGETLNNWFFNQLRDNYDYSTSEEAIIETIEANEYYFDLSGNIGTPDNEPTIKERITGVFLHLGARIKRIFTANFFRLTALTFMWLQMLAVLGYAVVQHPVIKPFLSR